MTSFAEFPNELKLSVLDHLTVDNLKNTLLVDTYLNFLTLDSIQSHILKKIETTSVTNTRGNSKLYLSTYSPQSKRKLVEIFNAVQIRTPMCTNILSTPKSDHRRHGNISANIDIENLMDKLKAIEYSEHLKGANESGYLSSLQSIEQDKYNTIFEVTSSKYARNPLDLNSREMQQDQAVESIPLVVNEDEKFIKLRLKLQLKDDKSFRELVEFDTKIAKTLNSGELISDDKLVHIRYELIKDSENNSPGYNYDYEVSEDYTIRFRNISIKSTYLLSCLEKVHS